VAVNSSAAQSATATRARMCDHVCRRGIVSPARDMCHTGYAISLANKMAYTVAQRPDITLDAVALRRRGSCLGPTNEPGPPQWLPAKLMATICSRAYLTF
jgi:hypothetical protein